MRLALPMFLVLAIFASITSDAVAATSKPLKLCLNSKSGALVSRTKCKKSETALSLATLSSKVTEQQGGAGSEFSVSFSDGAESNVTIPAATNAPFIGLTPGTKALTATCPSGIVHASSCESSDLTSVSVSAVASADGKSVQCFWSNSAFQDKVGRYFVKVVCADL